MTYPWLDEARREFARRLNGSRLAHACLLAGPQGLGKLELARQMASTLLCQQQGQQACAVCRSCQLFASGAHPDFRLLTFEINIKTGKMRTELVIDQVRELNAFMQLTHSISPRKVALIHPAESMNRYTANALLKTLEEPPGSAVLVLVAHDPSHLPATIRSRCQTIHVRLPDGKLALDWLVNSMGADAATAAIALRACAGSPLLAQQMLLHGRTEQFRAVTQQLARIQADAALVGEVVDHWSALDQECLWNWLSLITAQRVRNCFGLPGHGAAMVEGLERDADKRAADRQHHAGCISLLQSLADRNRRALATSLRKDLLLRDWLIQWSRLPRS